MTQIMPAHIAALLPDKAVAELADLDEMGRVPFGKLANQTMPVAWAAAMLALLKERHPAQFGALLGEVATGVDPNAGRRRRTRAADGADEPAAE